FHLAQIIDQKLERFGGVPASQRVAVITLGLKVELLGLHLHRRPQADVLKYAARQLAGGGVIVRVVQSRFEVREGLPQSAHLDHIGAVFEQRLQERSPVVVVVDAQVAGVAAADARSFRARQDRAQQLIRRISPHEEGWNADGRAEKYLTTLALDERVVGYIN